MPRADRPARRRQRDIRWALVTAAGALLLFAFGFAIAQLSARRSPQALSAAGLAVGAAAPMLALPATTGGTLSLGSP